VRTIDADRLVARIMRLSQGDLKAQWTAAGLIGVIEEEYETAKYEVAMDRIREAVKEFKN